MVVTIVSGAILASALSCGSHKPLDDLVVAVEQHHAVFLLSGTGSKYRVLQDQDLREGGSGIGYYSPAVRPDQASVVYVRCRVERAQADPGLKRSPGCELVESGIYRDTERIVMRATVLDSPSWSPDGKRLAVIADDRIVLLEPAGDRVLWETEVTGRDTGTSRIARHPAADSIDGDSRSYLRWSDDASELYLVVPTGDQRGIARIDSSAGDLKWLDLQVPLFSWRKYDPQRTAERGNILGRGAVIGGGSLPLDRAYSALFGSVENPVWNPAFSPDGRFYFYVTRREGAFANEWVEGYDTESHRVFRVRTLWWAPYAE